MIDPVAVEDGEKPRPVRTEFKAIALADLFRVILHAKKDGAIFGLDLDQPAYS